MNRYKFRNMFKEDVKNALVMIEYAHNGTPGWEWNGEVVEDKRPCEPFSEEWFDRIEDILYNQFEGAYQLLDFVLDSKKEDC